jgi:2-polyprenyl-3-methyl-5-hydroxy-6-metoxy-1,4-benzoquinol methylase
MRRIKGKQNTNTMQFWDDYYASVDVEHDRLIIYEQLADILETIRFNTILEIGCGTGIGAEYIKSKFDCIYTASDFSMIAVNKAAEKADYIKLLDIRKDDPVGEYDVIIIAETLEHLEDPFNVIDRCLKHCKYLVLSLPLDEPEDCDPEHIWCNIRPEDFIEYDVHRIHINEYYFQIILA